MNVGRRSAAGGGKFGINPPNALLSQRTVEFLKPPNLESIKRNPVVSKQLSTTERQPETQLQALIPQLRMVYRCHFCGDTLQKKRLSFSGAVMAIAGLRYLYCPHCFDPKLKAVSWLKWVLWPVFAVRQTMRWIFGLT
jgi:DNA-directed RNA polymerase subunit RPC12/RpoP